MESASNNDQSEMANLLKNIFTGQTENVQVATQAILGLSQQPVPFATLLLNIMQQESTDATSEKVKQAAAASIVRAFMDLVKKGKLAFEDRIPISRMTMEALFSPNTSLQIKVQLQYLLILLYSVEKGEEIMREGLEIVVDRFKSSQVHFYPAACFLLQAIINSPLNGQSEVAQCFEQLSQILIGAGGGLVQGIVTELENFNKDAQQESLLKISSGVKILMIWVKVIFDFIKILSAPQKDSKVPQGFFLPVMANNEMLAHILHACLMLTSTRGKQIEDCLVSLSEEPELDNPLNQLKSNVMRCINKFLDPVLMIELQKHLKGKENYINAHARDYGLTLALKTLVQFFKIPDLNIEQIHKSLELAEVFVECFIMISRMTIYATLHPLYLEVLPSLIVDVCLPLLMATEEEKEIFQSNPGRFAYYSMDTLKKQSTQDMKTNAARFLIDVCRFVDGAGTYASNIIFDMIHYSMVPDLPEGLAEHQNCYMLTRATPVARVETCLMAIGGLHSIIYSRKDIISKLENIFETYQTYFFGPESEPIIKARICAMIPFYIGSIFADKSESFIDLLKFVLQCAGVEGEGLQALSEQANETLFTMFEKTEYVQFLSPFVVPILQELTTYLLTTNNLRLFDVLYEIVTSFDKEIAKSPEVLLGLVTALMDRGMKEFLEIRAKPEHKKILSNKIWNIIRGIGEQDQYVLQYQQDIEKILDPMIDCLDANEDVDFDEDILNYIASATKISKAVSPSAWKVFQSSPKIFERYGGMLAHIFPVLNYITLYGSNVINSEPDTIGVLVKMGIQALDPVSTSADNANVSEGGLLLQLILQYLDPISEDLMSEILQATFKKLLETKKKYLRARFGGIFLCAFMKNFEMTQNILLRMEILPDVIDFFLKEVTIFEQQSYDRKLLIIGLSHILTQTNLDKAFEARFGEIFDVVFSVLRYVRYIEQIEGVINDDEFYDEDDEDVSMTKQHLLNSFLTLKGKTQLKDFNDYLKEINVQPGGHLHPDSEYEFEGEEEDEEEDEAAKMEKQEAASTVRAFETELKMKDEFACFKSAALMIKETRLPFIQDIISKLPETKKAFLIDVLQSQRIPVDEFGPGSARRIVKAGRKKIANVELENGNFVSK